MEARPRSNLTEDHPASDDAGIRSGKELELAYRYLNRRERTVSEMVRYLARHEIPQAAIDKAMAALVEQGYLDDARFARLFAEDKRRLEGWGLQRIARSLAERGVDRELIAEALDGDARDDELERAVELLRRRVPAPARTRRERDRALGVLIRKGYDSELALQALALHTRADSEEVQ